MAKERKLGASAVLVVLPFVLSVGCAHGAAHEEARPQSATDLSMAREARPAHAAHALLIEAASCWFGGLWGDVQGESPAERKADTVKRCTSLAHHVIATDDRSLYEELRAFDAVAIEALAARMSALADADPEEAPHKGPLLSLMHALADAQKETMLARRAGHRILRDVAREPEKLSSDEAAALPDLEAAKAFDALYDLDARDLGKEANAYALLVTLDRMSIAQEIPLHLKPYPVVEPLKRVFGVAIPALPHDASKPLPRAGWLTYLVTAASAAGHPVTAPAPPEIRHERAIQGILGGLSDKLRADAPGLTPPLSPIIEDVIRDLNAVAKPS